MDFFVSLKKYNKTAFFVLLAFVLFGIFTPDFHHANAIWPFTNVAEGISSLIRTVSEGLTSIMSSMAIIRHVIAAPGTFILAIWGLLARLLGVLAFFWALFFAAIFQVILYIFIQTDALSITKNTVFLTAWNQAKLYANMFIVLELIAAALMMILNLKMWGEPKKMVITVIAIALLVNFSIVVVGVMIDVSNILMAHLLLRGSSIAGIIGTVDEAWNQTLLGLPSTFISLEDTAMYMIMNFFFFGLYMVIGLAFIYFIFIFFQRYIYLAILFILSPLAFAAYSFPQTKHLFSQWWHHLLRNCFLGVEAAFFLKLSIDILHAGTGGLTNNNSDFLTQVFNNPMLSTVISGTTLTFMFNALFLVIVVIGFLLFGLRMAAKTAGPLADIVMAAVAAITVAVVEAIVTGGASLAATGEGFAAGAAKMATQGAGKLAGTITGSEAVEKKFGESKILQEKVVGGLTKVGEAAGLAAPGSSKSRDEAEKAKYQESYDKGASARNVTENVSMLEGAKGKSSLTREEAAALKQVIERGDINMVTKDTAEQARLLAAMGRHYGENTHKSIWAKAETQNAELAGDNKYHTSELALKNPGKDPEEISALAQKEAMRRTDKGEFKEMSADEAKSIAENENESESRRALAMRRLAELKRHREAFNGDEKEINRMLSLGDKYGLSTRKDAEEIDPELIVHNEKKREELAKPEHAERLEKMRKKINDDRLARGEAALLGTDLQKAAENEILIKEKVKSISTDDFGKLSDKAITERVWKYANETQKKRLMQKGTPEAQMKAIDIMTTEPISDEDLELLKEKLAGKNEEIKQKIADNLLHNVDAINPEHIALIPKDQIDDAISRHPKKAKLESRFKIAAAVPTKRKVTQQDVDKATAEDITLLRKMGYMMSEVDRKKDPFAFPLMDEYKAARAKAENKTIMPTIPKVGDTMEMSKSERAETGLSWLGKEAKLLKDLHDNLTASLKKEDDKNKKKEIKAKIDSIAQFIRSMGHNIE